MRTIKEQSRFRTIWDILLLSLIVVSLIYIPFQFAFVRKVNIISSVIIYVIDLIFMLDMVLNFRTSFRWAGKEVFDIPRIKKRYLKTGFWFHLISVIPLDIIFLMVPEMKFAGITMVLWLRLPRLFRFYYLFTILKRWQDRSWINPGYLRILKFSSTILFLAHVVSCGFFVSSFITSFPLKSWAVMENIVNSDIATQYIRSLYWAIATMTTVGYGDITPHLNHEYVFTIIVMIMGASFYAYIIGNIASMISTLDIRKANFWRRVDSVKMFLITRGVPKGLNQRIRNYYEYRWVNHRGLDEEHIFNDLPNPLRLELLKELTKDLLFNIPLFKYSSENLRKELLLSLKAKTFDPDSYIVNSGEVSKEIFFLSSGEVEVVDPKNNEVHCKMTSGEYFGELSIILGEKRNAMVRTIDFCETFVLQAEDFFRIKNEFSEFMEVIKKMSAERSDKTTKLMLKGIII